MHVEPALNGLAIWHKGFAIHWSLVHGDGCRVRFEKTGSYSHLIIMDFCKWVGISRNQFEFARKLSSDLVVLLHSHLKIEQKKSILE